MGHPNQNPKKSEAQATPAVTSEIISSIDDVPPATKKEVPLAELRLATQPPEAVEMVAVAPVKERMVEITPTKTETGMRIGPVWLSIQRGVKCKVSEGVAAHLRSKGLVA